MAIGPGIRIGPYEITALLGEGGMGKVWRAHHKGLKRDDALKVLPDAFASDSDRLARFQREAQVLASLNHPNIAHVYGLGRTDGVQALVMELVDGPTLADHIAEGPIPVDEGAEHRQANRGCTRDRPRARHHPPGHLGVWLCGLRNGNGPASICGRGRRRRARPAPANPALTESFVGTGLRTYDGQ